MTRRLAALTAAALTAACTLPPPTPPLTKPSAAATPAPAAPAETPAPPEPRRQTLVLPDAALDPDAAGRTVAVGREALPGRRHLLGLADGDLVALLGPPDFRRRDDPAQVWRYRDSACVLDVFLYRQASGTLKVAHVEARGHSVVHMPARRCLDSLLQTRNERPAG